MAKVIPLDAHLGRRGGWHQQFDGKKVSEEIDGFLAQLRTRLEAIILDDDGPGMKITMGDYLKLISVIEERLEQRAPEHKEIVVRWEDPDEETDCSN